MYNQCLIFLIFDFFMLTFIESYPSIFTRGRNSDRLVYKNSFLFVLWTENSDQTLNTFAHRQSL